LLRSNFRTFTGVPFAFSKTLMADPNPYQTLGVSQTATQEEIKDAYRALAKKYHPDLNPGNKQAERKFKEINAAYERVGTPEARTKFDRGETEAPFGTGGAGQGPFGAGRRGPFYYETQQNGGRYSTHFSEGFDFGNEDFFESLFREAQAGRASRAGRSTAHGPAHGQDELYRMEVDFKDAMLGAERDITLHSGKTLRIKIPPGIESGKRLRFRGQGGPAPQGGSPGDAYIEVQVRPSALFRRSAENNKNIEVEVPIGMADAVLGGEIEVPTLDGSVMLRVPSGVSSGAKLRVRGKGVPTADRESTERGDEIVILKIVLPREIDPELREFMSQWRKKGSSHAA
jgi:DnaJ-class molecular chaperone